MMFGFVSQEELKEEDMAGVNVKIMFDEKPAKEMFDAIHYLSTWSYGHYPLVEIYIDRNRMSGKDLYAAYLDDVGYVKYVIGAIWGGEKYSFHS